jgi:hypothetical protein
MKVAGQHGPVSGIEKVNETGAPCGEDANSRLLRGVAFSRVTFQCARIAQSGPGDCLRKRFDN